MRRARRERRARARAVLRGPDAGPGARRRGVPLGRGRDRLAAGPHRRPGARARRARGSSGTSTCSRRRRARRSSRRPTPARRRSSSGAPRPAVPPRGDDGDHGRLGAGRTATSSTPRAWIPTRCSRRRTDEPSESAGERDAAVRPFPARRGPTRRPTRRASERPADGAEADVQGTVRSDETSVFPASSTSTYPNVERGDGRLADHGGRSRDPRRVLGRRDGGLPRPRRPRAGGGRGRAQAERIAYYYNHHFTNEPQERLARPAARGRGAGDGARPVRVGRLRGDRDRAAAGEAVPRRAGRHRAMAGGLAVAGVPRLHDGDAGALRPRLAPRAVRAVSRAPPPHPAQHTAVRPDGRGRARGAGPGARGGRPGDRCRLPLRADQRGRAPRVLTAGTVLGGARANGGSGTGS